MPAAKTAVRRRAALGFRVHSGWAAAVAVAGTPARPEILERRRIEIADPGIRGAVQPYHAAEGMAISEAKRYLDQSESASARLARNAIAVLAADVRAKGCELMGAALLLASGRPLPALESVLASHALIHTADGEHFREAIVRGCEHAGLDVLRIREREVAASAAKRFRTTEAELMKRVGEAGKAVGAPWRADEKLAALVAWLALAVG
jgi:hypothetical protein